MSLVEMQQDQYLDMFTSSIKLLTVSLFQFHSVLRKKQRQLKLFCDEYSNFKVPNTLKMKQCTSLLLRNTGGCLCRWLVSTWDMLLSQVSVKTRCLRWNTHRTVMLRWLRLPSTVPPVAVVLYNLDVATESVFPECGLHITCKSTREMTPPAAPPPPPTSLCRFLITRVHSDGAQRSVTDK